MKVDNFNLLEPFLKYPTEDTFYFVQILKRRKDHGNEGMKGDVKIVRDYYLDNNEDFANIKQSIIENCDDNNARAYIRLNRRSKKKCALMLLKRLAERISYEQYNDLHRLYRSVAGEFASDEEKKWLIDVDLKEDLDNVLNWLKENQPENVYNCVPSPNGWHVILKAFDSREFVKVFPKVDTQKDATTILYANLKGKI